MAKLTMQDYKECWVCGVNACLEKHHIFFGTGNRKISDRYGLTVWLCSCHHRGSKEGVHFVRTLDLKLKKAGQRMFEQVYSREIFMQKFGRNYL